METPDFEVTVMFHCRFLIHHRCAPVGEGAVPCVESYACVGVGDLGGISVLSSHFCCEPKATPQKLSLLRNSFSLYFTVCEYDLGRHRVWIQISSLISLLTMTMSQSHHLPKAPLSHL